ncbi:PH domain-containing protein [Rhodohalobacter sp. 8-1]|uniref:PH domain-containing protein n=1 Tax=Rhodohalobacter sp. 8-1 TaxID=3131972 RepID=UPI0030EF128B
MDKSSSKKLAPAIIGVWRWGSAIGYLFLLGLPVIYYSIFGMQNIHFWLLIAISLVVMALWITAVFIVPPISWTRWRYSINENEIDLLRGIIVRKETLIPLSRVQHVDTRQGPLLRWFNLSSVTISTAATTHEIPGLDDVIADKVRKEISMYARLAEEDV